MNTHHPKAEGSPLSPDRGPVARFNPTWLSLGALACLAALLVALLGFNGSAQSVAAAHADEPAAEISSRPFVATVGFTVSDMDRALDFYTNVLTFHKISDVEVTGEDYEDLQGLFGLRMRVCRLKLGDECLELTEYLAPSTGRPIPPDSRSNDGWFQHIAIIVSDIDGAYAHLRQHKVRHASTGPQTIPSWNENAGGIRAFYFKDPDNHVLEILWFPRDKGAAKWHMPTKQLFLGIDHTAIVVANTDKSLKFYRDTLGMAVAGGAENYGTEQEHLNNVPGAHLRITSLRFTGESGDRGPAIELLEYLAPRDGSPFPVDTKANDLWHWQVTIDGTDPANAVAAFNRDRTKWISSGLVERALPLLGISAGLSVRDPDGHALRLVKSD